MCNSHGYCDLIGRLMDTGCALSFLAEAFDAANEFGPAKLIALAAEDVSAVAEQMDNEGWQASKEAEADQSAKVAQVPRELKNDDEAIQDLKDIFSKDEEISASLKGLIATGQQVLAQKEKAA